MSFCAISGWPVTSQAIQCWGRPVLEGWAGLVFVEFFREQYEASWLARGLSHESRLCHCWRALSGRLSPIYVSHLVLLILLSHDRKFQFCSSQVPGRRRYFNRRFHQDLRVCQLQLQLQIQIQSKVINVSLLNSFEPPTTPCRGGSLCRSSTSLATLSSLPPPPQSWQIILHLSDSNYRAAIKPNLCRCFTKNEPEQL